MQRHIFYKALYSFFCIIFMVEGGNYTTPAITFLDTLNRGKELRFSAADSVSQSIETPPPVSISENDDNGATEVNSEVQREAGIVPSRFMVQVLAATSQQQVKVEKRNIAAKVKLPVSISYDVPYYKLYVGDFAVRADAENVLAQVKKLGYNDAWIVRVSTTNR
jgi:hypothetical protein